ncbi:MAG: hypothetical protein CVU42_04145 [Chloroflexi bacterium HGW-Chloroflexi-4]|nr:MAG: hypothetical protein CVU42_04145 [Chloroflexi bacterium HGW-Chloroflexi-4]
MKKNRVLGFLVIAVLLFALFPVGNVSAATKVAVCHLDDMGLYHLITISESAFPAHVAHGDASPGELVPGMAGKKFTADCSIIDVKTLVDTVSVPSSGVTVYSSAVLQSGITYEMVANGTYKFVNWTDAGIADARCSLRIPGSYNTTGAIAWIDGAVFPGSLQYYLQVWVGGNHVEWGTGCETETHTYTSSITGAGTTASFKIWDNAYGDNSGSIEVKIYKYN